MAFKSIKVNTGRSKEPLVTIKKPYIAFNAVLMRSLDVKPQTVDIKIDEENSMVAFAFDKPGFKLSPESDSQGMRVSSKLAFNAMPWAIDGKYEVTYDKKSKLWIITMDGK